jgi:endonuclease III
MPNAPSLLARLLDRLERHYGPQQPCWPADPYLFLVWWHSGYPASDAACERGWQALSKIVGATPQQLLAATPAQLAASLKPGGLVPELRVLRLKEIAARVQDEFGGDLRAALVGPESQARKILKSFPGIADPGADRILLFSSLAPVAAVPSNCVHVLTRVLSGNETANYNAEYREARNAVEAEIPAKFDARMRAYLLVKRHGQELCKRTNPKCDRCPVSADCRFYAASVIPARQKSHSTLTPAKSRRPSGKT